MPAPSVAIDKQRPIAAVVVSRGAGDRRKIVLLDDSGQIDASMLPETAIATADALGMVKIGEGLVVAEDGTVSVASIYALPAATETTLGGVMVGEGLAVAEDGMLSLRMAEQNQIGGVIVGEGLAIEEGVLSYVLPPASESQLGGVKVGGNLQVDDDGLLIYTLPPASEANRGGVIVGDGLQVDDGGRVSLDVDAIPASTPVSTTIHAATNKTTPVDADELALLDSADSYAIKKTTIAELKVILGGGSKRMTVSIPGTLTAFVGALRWVPRANVTLTSVWVDMGNAPTNVSGAVFNVRVNGTALFTSSKPTVAQSAHSSTPLVISQAMTADTDYLTVDVELASGADATMFIDYTEG